jgi:hypothetical protein
MLDTVKMAKAWSFFEKAMQWELEALAGKRTMKMVEMALNQACKLELEALGFKVLHTSFSGPGMGAINAAIR